MIKKALLKVVLCSELLMKPEMVTMIGEKLEVVNEMVLGCKSLLVSN